MPKKPNKRPAAGLFPEEPKPPVAAATELPPPPTSAQTAKMKQRSRQEAKDAVRRMVDEGKRPTIASAGAIHQGYVAGYENDFATVWWEVAPLVRPYADWAWETLERCMTNDTPLGT